MNQYLHQYRKRYRQLSLPLKAAFWFTVCNFLMEGISFITVPLFSGFLSSYEYGIVSLYNSYQQIFLILTTLELSQGACQRGILRYKEDVDFFTWSLQLLWTVITIALFGVFWVFRKEFVRLTDTDTATMCLMFLYFLVQPAYACWLNRKRFAYDYRIAVVTTVVFTSLISFGSLAAVLVAGRTALVKIKAALCLEIICYLVFYIRNIHLKRLAGRLPQMLEQWSFALKFQLPLVAHSFSYLILAQSDRIMIGSLIGKSQAALYSVAYSLANVTVILQTSLHQVLKPWIYQKLEAKEYGSIYKDTVRVLLLIACAILGFILVAPELMKLLFRSEYYSAVWVIPPIAVSVFFMLLYSVFTDVESYYSRTKYIMYASVVCAAVNILLNYIVIQIWGYIACGYTTLLSYILFAVLHYYFMRKVCRAEAIPEPVFDTKMILALSLGILVLSFAETLLYPLWVVRYAVLVLLCIAALWKRKPIADMIRKFMA
ncbi:MAG: oligosaccharide flippase family protein [Clostridiales bacterium]|nr:oligosaccharide flippase family protein [Clostridiales bacterium]